MSGALKTAVALALLSCLTGCEYLLGDYSVGEDCYDGEDNDGDGDTDCWDSDCAYTCGCDWYCPAKGYSTWGSACGEGRCACDLTYQENFDSAGDWYTGAGDISSWSVEEGKYQGFLHEARYISWAPIPTDDFFSNFTVECDIITLTGDTGHTAGLLFYLEDKDNYYRFGIGSGNYMLGSFKDRDWTAIQDWTSASSIKPHGSWNNVKITVHGSLVDVCVNGILLGSFDGGGAPDSGDIAVYVSTYDSAGCISQFDNLRVYLEG